jgi:hypothetical protein
MSVPFNSVYREAEVRALLAELATKVETFTPEQAELLSENEQHVRHAISGCVRAIALWRQRAGFLMKLGITLIALPAHVYATFVTSSVVHASPHTSLVAAALMAVLACSQHIALWWGPFNLVRRSVVGIADRYAMRQLERRLMLMRLRRRAWGQQSSGRTHSAPVSGRPICGDSRAESSPDAR